MENKELTKLGQALKKARLKKGVSQEKLAEIVGVDRTYISLLERGKRNPSALSIIAISKALQSNLFSYLDKEV